MPIYEYRCTRCRKVTDKFSHIPHPAPYVECTCLSVAVPVISVPAQIRHNKIQTKIYIEDDPLYRGPEAHE